MSDPRADGAATTVSVCISNYNYARFVGRAVASALEQTHPALEVLVVDDGSTDDSLEVLRSFGDRITVLAKANGGHISAVNAGWAAARGEVVLFLDADDTLEPHALERVVGALRPGSAKCQFRLAIVDAEDRVLGVYPHRLLPLDSGDVTPLILEQGEYVGPVSSGNAYTRHALASVMPLAGPTYDSRLDGNGPDGYLNSLTPFYGTVESVDEVLGSYRSHGANHSAASGQVPLRFLRWRIDHELGRAAEIERHAARQGRRPRPDVMCGSPEHVLVRLLSLRADPAGHPVPEDTRRYLLRQALTRGPRARATPSARRLLLVVAAVLAAVLPRRALPALAEQVLGSAPRPQVLRWLARLLGR